ncbi:hypothetical protein BS47DRAFT_1364146 [Hydnum rufescens UP504]|uniref:Uncharacterized protein n=1 Tax=Hydnum rufescens UP504 TaxID=1448309 RepID=A0A9P6AS36_9AGAM|nr:hypothetical protein BS47DRAFT_1364146 [Hydnum rufescens UP504]
MSTCLLHKWQLLTIESDCLNIADFKAPKIFVIIAMCWGLGLVLSWTHSNLDYRYDQYWAHQAKMNSGLGHNNSGLQSCKLCSLLYEDQCNEVPPRFRRTLIVVLGQSGVNRLGAGWEGIRGEEGERVITSPLALALGGGAAHRAKHWLCPEHRRKGCEGMGMMVKRYDVVTGQVAQSLPKERKAGGTPRSRED